MARGSRGAGQEQAAGPRCAERASSRREKTQENFHRSAGEEKSGGLFRGATAAVRREDHGDRGEAGPQEERGARVVLQPATETEADEVCGAALTGGRRRRSAVSRARVRLLSTPLRRAPARPSALTQQ